MKIKAVSLVTAILLAAASALEASPKSSAPFQKALGDATMLASLNPAWSVHRTMGDSMGDFFGNNSLILVQQAEFAAIEAGMMIVYRNREGELISHKVVARNGDTLATRGVANLRNDPDPVTAENLVGAIFGVFHTSGAPAGEVTTAGGATIPTALCKSY